MLKRNWEQHPVKSKYMLVISKEKRLIVNSVTALWTESQRPDRRKDVPKVIVEEEGFLLSSERDTGKIK